MIYGAVSPMRLRVLVGLTTAAKNALLYERKGRNRNPAPREASTSPDNIRSALFARERYSTQGPKSELFVGPPL